MTELKLDTFASKIYDIGDGYPVEGWGRYEDDGRMLENVQALEQEIVGDRIVSAEVVEPDENAPWYDKLKRLKLTLSSGRSVYLRDSYDCCAYTELDEFLLHPEAVNHVIMGVGTTDGYQTWHIYADFGDIMAMRVGWSCGNPFYYGYGFDITVEDVK